MTVGPPQSEREKQREKRGGYVVAHLAIDAIIVDVRRPNKDGHPGAKAELHPRPIVSPSRNQLNQIQPRDDLDT